MTEKFDRRALNLKSLHTRESKLAVRDLIDPASALFGSAGNLYNDARAIEAARVLAKHIVLAKESDRKVILFMGAHLIKLGLSRFITKLILDGYIDHVATNGACAIHDFELNTHGATSEDVQTYIDDGQFGLWEETAELNDVIVPPSSFLAHCGRSSYSPGAGHVIGEHLYHNEGASTETSIFAACHKMNVPITVHILIGGDINHSHPNFDAAAWGLCSYNDFLIFVESLRGLHNGGVFLNIGSAVHGPEIFLKALSMVRNVSQCDQFTTGVFDFVNLPSDWRSVEPHPQNPLYYFRPWKTLLLRTNKGGHSEYVAGDFAHTIPLIYREILAAGDSYGTDDD